MAISGVTHKLFQTLTVNINSLARFKDDKGRTLPSNTIKYCQTKAKLSYIISDSQTKTVRQKNVKNEMTILRTVVMIKFNNKLM